MTSTKILAGIDIQPIDEVDQSLKKFGNRYGELIYTADERDVCGHDPKTAARLAARFAAKEAVLKVLDFEETMPPWRFIEVQGNSRGGPVIALHASAADLAQRQGVKNLRVSLSRAAGVAIAAVVAEVASKPEESKL